LRLISPIDGNAVARAAWTMAYFGRTLYFNGPGASSTRAKAFLRDEGDVADSAAIVQMLLRNVDPISELLDRTIDKCYKRLGRAARSVKRDRWERAEPTLNARCRLALALLEPRIVRHAMSRLVSQALPDRALRLSRVHPDLDDKWRFGTPDILVSGPSCSVMLEMKVRGLPSRHMYDLKQLVQYLNLAADDRASSRRSHVFHILLRPVGGGQICTRRNTWFPSSTDGKRIHLSASRLKALVRKEDWGPRLEALAAIRSLSRVPVFERTYGELFSAVPISEWKRGYGRIAQRQLQIVLDLAEPRKGKAVLEEESA
jgi:hypothetical protein